MPDPIPTILLVSGVVFFIWLCFLSEGRKDL